MSLNLFYPNINNKYPGGVSRRYYDQGEIAMIKWEYCQVQYNDAQEKFIAVQDFEEGHFDSGKPLLALLNQLGRQGWELCIIDDVHSHSILTLKRPIES